MDSQGLCKIEINGDLIYVLYEWNNCYGNLIKSFEINNIGETDVNCRFTGKKLVFSANNSLCGERAFEDNSIVYEYLIKPLGLDKNKFPKIGKDGWDTIYEFYNFKAQIESKGGVVTEINRG